jgi:tetratricopeptide (TPR) repeat protein
VYEHKVYNTLGEIYLDLGMYAQAMSSFTEAKVIRKKIGEKSPWLILNIGNVYYQQEKYIKARENYYRALDIFNSRSKDGPNQITGRKVSLSNLGRIEVKIKNYDKALSYFKEALDVAANNTQYRAFKKSAKQNKVLYPGTARGVAYQHYLISNLFLQWGKYDLALEEIRKTDDILKTIINKNSLKKGNPSIQNINLLMGKNYSLLTEINTLLKNYDVALEQSRMASQLLKKWPHAFVDHLQIESDYFASKEELYLALESLDRGLKICIFQGLDLKEIELLEKKKNLLKENNLERSALDIAEAIINKKNMIQKDRMRSLFEEIEHKSDLMLRKEQLSKAKGRQVLVSSLLGALLIILGIVALNLRNSKRFTDQNAKLVRREKELINDKLKNKENDLARMSTYIVSKNDLLNSIISDLDYHTSLIENKKDRRLMVPLKKKISEKIDESADWDQFQVQFSSAYPKFIEKLTSQYSNLRSGDIKLCCYLKMNMNTKDIAQIAGLSVRAIENKRYRLRKKLNLSTDVSLESFLHSSNNVNKQQISGNGVS